MQNENSMKSCYISDNTSGDFESSFTSLTAINEDCLLHIVHYLNIMDVINLATTYLWLQYFAKTVFYPKKAIKIKKIKVEKVTEPEELEEELGAVGLPPNDNQEQQQPLNTLAFLVRLESNGGQIKKIITLVYTKTYNEKNSYVSCFCLGCPWKCCFHCL